MGDAEEILRLERDVYRRVLALRGRRDVDAALTELLAAVVGAAGAQRGYLEINGAAGARPRWTRAHGCTTEETEAIRAVTSRGIVTAALAAGTTLHVPFAALDDRFAALPSVRDQRLEAVLCVPLDGVGAGVLYLEGRRGAGPFSDAAVELAEDIARHVGPSVEHAARATGAAGDPTRPFRDRMRLDAILGRSAALARVFEEIAPFTNLDITMLLTGASGTGKTQLARAVHDNSRRRGGPFVEVNCGAIKEHLIEAELFGSRRGAFTDAIDRGGLVHAAEGGTLFLDEIAELPLKTQSTLLQLLNSRQYHAVGDTRLITANIRIIAATNVDLPAMIEANLFRDDLYNRLNVVSVRMPSLAERRSDIPILVDDLLPRLAAEYGVPALPASDRLRFALEGGTWEHGNVRDLRNKLINALGRAAAEGAAQIEVRHLPPDARPDSDQPLSYQEATRQYQRDLVRRELEACDWNVNAVAERLDLSRAHVYNLINQFQLTRK